MTDDEVAQEVRLTGLQRAEFAKAARLLTWISMVQILIGILAGLGPYVANDFFAYCLATASLAMVVAWAFLSFAHRRSRDCAERARRSSLLIEGLGLRLTQSARLERESLFTVSAREGQKHEDHAYYASTSLPGPQRLIEMLEETAFWSSRLMIRSQKILTVACVLLALASAAAVLGTLPVASPERLTFVRALAAAFSVVVVADLVGSIVAFSVGADRLRHIMTRLESLRSQSTLSPELVAVLCEYNSTVESTPMFLPKVYKSYRDELNMLWRTRRGAR